MWNPSCGLAVFPQLPFMAILDYGVQLLRMSCSNTEAKSPLLLSLKSKVLSLPIQVRSQLFQHLHSPVLTGCSWMLHYMLYELQGNSLVYYSLHRSLQKNFSSKAGSMSSSSSLSTDFGVSMLLSVTVWLTTTPSLVQLGKHGRNRGTGMMALPEK